MNSKDASRREKGTETVRLHWQLCEDEGEWHSTQQQLTIDTALSGGRQRLPVWRRWWPVLLGVMLLPIIGGVVCYQAQSGLAKIETELQATVDAEPWLPIQPTAFQPSNTITGWQGQLAHESEQLRGLAEPGELVTKLKVVNLGDDWAVVEVEVQRAEEAVAYRQKRVYRQTAQGWVRIAPSTAHWGRPQQRESRYFVFQYFSQDETAVIDLVDQADALYATLSASLFLDLPSDDKVVVKIDPTWKAGELSQPSLLPDTLIVPSPAATLTPAALGAGDVLIQSLALVLFDHLATQASRRYLLPDNWVSLRNGLRLWLTWETEMPLAVWHEPLVYWVFWDPRIPTMPDHATVPAFAVKLCLDHQLWMATPLEMGVPVSCRQRPGGGLEPLTWRFSYPPPVKRPLPQLMPDRADNEQLWGIHQFMGETVALATVMEYAATTYGADCLPILLASFREHETTTTLVPAVFGVSLVDFTAGWRTFLTERYDLAQ